MALIEAEALIATPAEEVFKLLHDPTRHAEWWVGVDSVDGVSREPDGLHFSVASAEHPGASLEQRLEPLPEGGIVMTCLQYGIRFRWRVVPEGEATRVQVRVHVPESAGELADGYRRRIPASLERLATLCERSADARDAG